MTNSCLAPVGEVFLTYSRESSIVPLIAFDEEVVGVVKVSCPALDSNSFPFDCIPLGTPVE